MNKQELIEKIKEIGTYDVNIFGTKVDGIPTESAIYLIKQLDEPQAGHADEAPRYVKNILARLRELPLHDREVWLKAIMAEFEQDFSHAKWREGYEQGKFEGEWVGQQLKDADKIRRELNKPVVKQFVADWIDVCKENLAIGLYIAMNPDFLKQYNKSNELITWIRKHKNQDIFARAWLDGYEVEKETKYTVKVKATKQYLCNDELGPHFSPSFRSNFTKTNLEELGFGWVFDCEGVEVEEV